MKTILYFAYGSNMLLQRLKSRCGSVRFHCIASVPGYEIAFIKKSKDRSGKATLLPTTAEAARIYGVVFQIDENEIKALDAFEGRGSGYERIDDFRVETEIGAEFLIVSTYIAASEHLDSLLQPYDWYLDLIVAGAEQAELPETYIQMLRATAAIEDPKPERPTRLEALRLLTNLMKKANSNEE